MTIFLRLLRYALYLALAGVLLGGLALATAYWLIAPGLPSVETLKDVRLQVPLRIDSADAKLIATFCETKRTPVRIENVPERLKHAFLAACTSLDTENDDKMIGIVLTGGLKPSPAILRIIRAMPIPVLVAQQDSYEVASKVHDLTVKTRPTDVEKISLIRDLIAENVNVDRILETI